MLVQTISEHRADFEAKSYTTDVHIGAGCYAQAAVLSNKIYVHIGLGIHTEMSLDEAMDVSMKRMNIIDKKLATLQAGIDAVVADIEGVGYILIFSSTLSYAC